jgi:hypothetical protein
MSAPLPTVCLLDDQEPPGLRGALSGLAALHRRPGAEDLVWLVCGDHGDLQRRLAEAREARGRAAPVLAWTRRPVDRDRRLDAIRDGAEDMVSLDRLIEVISRRVRATLPPPLLEEEELEVAAYSAAAPAGGAILAAPAPEEDAETLARWLKGMSPYLTRRNALWQQLGDFSPSDWFAACHLRERVQATAAGREAPGVYSLGRSGFRQRMAHRAALQAPRDEQTQITNIGTDGLCLSVSQPLPLERELALEVRAGDVLARVRARPRWQRPSPGGGWLVGCLVLSVELG